MPKFRDFFSRFSRIYYLFKFFFYANIINTDTEIMLCLFHCDNIELKIQVYQENWYTRSIEKTTNRTHLKLGTIKLLNLNYLTKILWRW